MNLENPSVSEQEEVYRGCTKDKVTKQLYKYTKPTADADILPADTLGSLLRVCNLFWTFAGLILIHICIKHICLLSGW